MIAPTLETPRVRLRHHQATDIAPLVELMMSERAGFIGVCASQREAWQWIVSEVGSWSLLGIGSWGVELRETGELIGQIGINKQAHFPEVEIGWLLLDGFEGLGLAREGAEAALRWGFAQEHIPGMVSYITPENIRSIRLAERLGAAHDPFAPLPEGETPEETAVYRHDYAAFQKLCGSAPKEGLA